MTSSAVMLLYTGMYKYMRNCNTVRGRHNTDIRGLPLQIETYPIECSKRVCVAPWYT